MFLKPWFNRVLSKYVTNAGNLSLQLTARSSGSSRQRDMQWPDNQELSENSANGNKSMTTLSKNGVIGTVTMAAILGLSPRPGTPLVSNGKAPQLFWI
jgi:hypothetical protein